VNRTEKIAAVEQLNEMLQASPHVILTSFQGLNVNQANELRSKIRSAGGRFTVIKNRLAKRAAGGTTAEPLIAQLEGPCALATHDSDPVVLAKTLAAFSKTNPELKLLAGVIDAKDVLELAGVKQLAALPGLNELRAQLLSLIQMPATTLVRLLGTPATQISRALDARKDKLEEEA